MAGCLLLTATPAASAMAAQHTVSPNTFTYHEYANGYGPTEAAALADADSQFTGNCGIGHIVQAKQLSSTEWWVYAEANCYGD